MENQQQQQSDPDVPGRLRTPSPLSNSILVLDLAGTESSGSSDNQQESKAIRNDLMALRTAVSRMAKGETVTNRDTKVRGLGLSAFPAKERSGAMSPLKVFLADSYGGAASCVSRPLAPAPRCHDPDPLTCQRECEDAFH